MCQYTTKQTEPGTLWCVSVLETVRQKKCTLSSFCFCTYFYNFLLLSFKKKCWPGWLHPDASLGRLPSMHALAALSDVQCRFKFKQNKTKKVFSQLYILCCSTTKKPDCQNMWMRQKHANDCQKVWICLLLRQILFLKRWYLSFYSQPVLVVPPK